VVPNLFLPNFGKFLKNHLAADFLYKRSGLGWGKMALGRARLNAPGRVRKGDAKLVRLIRVLLSCNNKNCHNAFSPWTLKFTFVPFSKENCF
jgi:hypothetical protein